jgi:cephalosporin hydroxylase
MNPIEKFNSEVVENIRQLGLDADLHGLSRIWSRETIAHQYTYNFSWLGRPIIQYPQDIVAIQELIWQVKPDLIIETGIAHGGSLIFSASMLALLDLCEAINSKKILDPAKSARKVVGVDIDIRAHNKKLIEDHPMASRIQMIQGSSIEPDVINMVSQIASSHLRVMVFLDSNHTHSHVRAELEAYAPLTTVGSYCVVMDTAVEDMPKKMFTDRPWGPGNSPKTAVWDYLKTHSEFEIDKSIPQKLLITEAPDGYLKRVS